MLVIADCGAHDSLAFVTQQKEIDTLAKTIARKATGDAVVWLTYPKGTSKRFKSAINMYTSWTPLGEAAFESVRRVAIDEDWSAKRFRRVEFIKSMTREKGWAMTSLRPVKRQLAVDIREIPRSSRDHRSSAGIRRDGPRWCPLRSI